MQDFSPHPAAEIFPAMPDEQYRALVEDIKAHGQIEPIVVHDGMILDGRHRFRACAELGIAPVTKPWCDSGEPLDFVLSMNLHRRHLTTSQLGIVAARICTLKVGRPQKLNVPHGTITKTPSDHMLMGDAAKKLGVGRMTVFRAKRVLRDSPPEDIKAVERGTMTVNAALSNLESPNARKIAGDKKRRRTMSAQSRVYRQLLRALTEMGGLPRAADVAKVASASVQGRRRIDELLTRATTWMKEFEHEWTRNG